MMLGDHMCDQSQSSLYAKFTSWVGPPKHRLSWPPLALKDYLSLVLFFYLARGYENMNVHLFNTPPPQEEFSIGPPEV